MWARSLLRSMARGVNPDRNQQIGWVHTFRVDELATVNGYVPKWSWDPI